MKTLLINFTCIGLMLSPYCYAKSDISDCDAIKDDKKKVECQEAEIKEEEMKIKEEIEKIEKSEQHVKWEKMDHSQQESAIHSTLKTRQLEPK